ncbi:MAG: hypothetical protein COZ69_13435 [Deltaproteobacteria bacterium CG_4_8_14_3_um_filter_45_9]|jgi:hypothetical protein|nr:MAG: hypothetical protein COS40_12865 [Deltaproteobacteria bacterium CG03_land_8_20_14_0_80_45_14]PIX21696.1 MAG: hypothetical protein COZ69_13435 [Deltaproteobacteria bacterium CG_4_8_14_3_um_filter_45_9]
MKKRMVFKTFVYFLSISFLLLTNGFPRIVAEAAEKSFPIGEMVSKGEVNFEARENVWRKVEPSHFPVFQGVKIKTEKGVAGIALGNNSHIEVGQNSLFSFDQNDRLHLRQGGINFRISPNAELNFKIGSLLVTKSRSLQASKGPIVASPKNEETIGTISIHSNGAATVKSIRGPLFILDQDRAVLASLSSQDSVTIPSATVKGPSKALVAQAGETAKGLPEAAKVSGAATGMAGAGVEDLIWVWVGVALTAGMSTGIIIEDQEKEHPLCP